MDNVETKVTAATVASALVPLIMLGATLFGWQVDEQAVLTMTMAAATVLIPLVTFVGGYFKSSETSSVSDDFVAPPQVTPPPTKVVDPHPFEDPPRPPAGPADPTL